jgi:hexulose-6-phosphate isomerase
MADQRVGFIQGRLSPLRNGRIQSFPWETWREEFKIGSRTSLKKIEWTIDSENFISNPLITLEGRVEIIQLKSYFNIEIPSVTCDYFMENPPWKNDPKEVFAGVESILSGMIEIGSKVLVIPLVDNSSLDSSIKTSDIRNFFEPLRSLLSENDMKIAFETDLDPESFSKFLSEFDEQSFGVNYDIGNSASLGFDPAKELESIGARVINVHIKDRILGGPTVPLGAGNADFPTVFRCLDNCGYVGNLIMQTARAEDGDHLAVLTKYRDQVLSWIDEVK